MHDYPVTTRFLPSISERNYLHQKNTLSLGTADFFGLNQYTTIRATFEEQGPSPSYTRDTGVTLSAPSDWPASETSEWEKVGKLAFLQRRLSLLSFRTLRVKSGRWMVTFKMDVLLSSLN